MMSLFGGTVKAKTFMEDSSGWGTGRKVELGLFLEPRGLPIGFLVDGFIGG